MHLSISNMSLLFTLNSSRFIRASDAVASASFAVLDTRTYVPVA